MRLPAKEKNAYLKWAHKFHGLVDEKIGTANNSIIHLWHGSVESRQYLTRYDTLRDRMFDATRYLKKSQHGAWELLETTEKYEEVFIEYFKSRKMANNRRQDVPL